MAAGDILSFIVDASGWKATVKVEGVGVGGAYGFNLGATNDPTNANIKLDITSQGYDNTGSLGTAPRESVGVPCITNDTGAMRLAYPNETDPNETVVGSDVDIVIALSKPIFSADTSITVDFLSGWYDDGTASNAVTDLAITNNSALAYPKPQGNWAYPGYSKITGDIEVEVAAFEKLGMVACVKISATDGSTTQTETVTSMTKSSKTDANVVLVYAATLDTSGFNDGVLTYDFEVFPSIGNASTILDSSDAVNTWPTPLYTSQKYRLDTASDHGYTVVDTTSGNDGTGVVYNSQVLAEAGLAFQTADAALTAMQTYHNTNASHNDAGGGTFLLTEDTMPLGLANDTIGGTMTEWCVFKPISTAAKANTNITHRVSGSANRVPYLVRFQGVTHIGDGFYRGYDTGAGGTSAWFDDCHMAQTGLLTIYQTRFSQATNCTGIFTNELNQFGGNYLIWAIIRGNALTTSHFAVGYTSLGNDNVECQERDDTNNPVQNNGIFAFNTNLNGTDDLKIDIASAYDIDSFALVQNLFVRYGNQATPLVRISGDSALTTTNNITMLHNSFVGSRANVGYNDNSTGGAYAQTRWAAKNNIYSQYNTKDDVFATNGLAIGGWPVGYSVGASGNFYRTFAQDEWGGEFQGLHMVKGSLATPKEPLYVLDNSADGNNTSGGDYHLQETSEAIGLSKSVILPYDLEGTARIIDGAAGAYEFFVEPVVPDDLVLSAMALEEATVSAIIISTTPNDLVLSAIILEEATASIIGSVSPDDLVLSSVILGQTKESSVKVDKDVKISFDDKIPYILFRSNDMDIEPRSTFATEVSFKDPSGNAVTPKIITYTLTDNKGNVINSVENVSITPPASTVPIAVDGDSTDNATLKTVQRKLTVTGVYDSVQFGNNRNIVDKTIFNVLGNL